MCRNVTCLLLFLMIGSWWHLCGAAEITLNGWQTSFPIETEQQTWRFQYQRQFQDKDELALWGAELGLATNSWKQHKQHAHIKGCNGDIKTKIMPPGAVANLAVQARITNYADSLSRTVSLSYSLNGYEYQQLQEEVFQGAATLSGAVSLAGHAGPIWLRLRREYEQDDQNGKHGFVLWSDFSMQLDGVLLADAGKVSSQPEASSYRLQEVFPTGVFWPWERTKPNADFAGMELWEFVDQTMRLLREHNCDTLWFVNIGPGENARHLLALAEKHQLKVLLNTGLLTYFYNNVNSWKDFERQARHTVNEIGHSPALLGYVLKDEPLLCSVGQLSHFNKIMKRVDPLGRDSVAVVMNRQSQTYLEDSTLPVICSDIYYFGHDHSTNIPNPSNVSQREFSLIVKGMNVVAAQRGKHSWLMPQMFGDVWGRHYRRGDVMVVEPGAYLHWRMPTDAETRWQIWEGLRLGSNGMLFYVLLPPVPLFQKTEDVQPDTPEAKKVASMDKLAATAKSWKKQKLTEVEMEIDPGEGVLQPGGQPTPQMKSMAQVFKVIRKHDKLLNKRKMADFPVFFAADKETAIATFVPEEAPESRVGIVVNNNLTAERLALILLPPNISRVVDLMVDKELPLVAAEAPFQACEISLPPGGGALLQAEFVDNDPGAMFFRENFSQHDQHKVRLSSVSSRVVRHGNFGMYPFYGVVSSGSGDEPVFTIENLTNPSSARNTILMNLNSRREQGVVFCQLEGELSGVRLYAVGDQSAVGQATNVMHLQEGNQGKDGAAQASHPMTLLQDRDFHRPVSLPVGTTSLQVFMAPEQEDAMINKATIWFVPATPK